MSNRPFRKPLRLSIELLEDRVNPSPVLFADVLLPGAGAVWDYSRASGAASPKFVDLNGDGNLELLTVSADQQMYAYSYNAGSGQPTLMRHYTMPAGAGQLESTPVIADLPTINFISRPAG